MKLFLILFLMLFISCSQKNLNTNNYDNFFFPDNLSFDEFKLKLENYSNKSSYPNLNE